MPKKAAWLRHWYISFFFMHGTSVANTPLLLPFTPRCKAISIFIPPCSHPLATPPGSYLLLLRIDLSAQTSTVECIIVTEPFVIHHHIAPTHTVSLPAPRVHPSGWTGNPLVLYVIGLGLLGSRPAGPAPPGPLAARRPPRSLPPCLNGRPGAGARPLGRCASAQRPRRRMGLSGVHKTGLARRDAASGRGAASCVASFRVTAASVGRGPRTAIRAGLHPCDRNRMLPASGRDCTATGPSRLPI